MVVFTPGLVVPLLVMGSILSFVGGVDVCGMIGNALASALGSWSTSPFCNFGAFELGSVTIAVNWVMRVLGVFFDPRDGVGADMGVVGCRCGLAGVLGGGRRDCGARLRRGLRALLSGLVANVGGHRPVRRSAPSVGFGAVLAVDVAFGARRWFALGLASAVFPAFFGRLFPHAGVGPTLAAAPRSQVPSVVSSRRRPTLFSPF